MNANTLRSAVVPMLLRAAQQEGLIRVTDVRAWLADAGLPSSQGTAHGAIVAETIDPTVAMVLLERMSAEVIAYGSAREAGGTFRRSGNTTGCTIIACASMLQDMSAVLSAVSDGVVDDAERPVVLAKLAQVRDQAAGLIERIANPSPAGGGR